MKICVIVNDHVLIVISDVVHGKLLVNKLSFLKPSLISKLPATVCFPRGNGKEGATLGDKHGEESVLEGEFVPSFFMSYVGVLIVAFLLSLPICDIKDLASIVSNAISLVLLGGISKWQQSC